MRHPLRADGMMDILPSGRDPLRVPKQVEDVMRSEKRAGTGVERGVTPIETSYSNAPSQTIDVGGTSFAYRDLGPSTDVPVIFLNHLAAVLDNWDPASSTGSPRSSG